MEFFRQEYWSELPFPPPGDLPDSGNDPESPALAGFFTRNPSLTTEDNKILKRSDHSTVYAVFLGYPEGIGYRTLVNTKSPLYKIAQHLHIT